MIKYTDWPENVPVIEIEAKLRKEVVNADASIYREFVWKREGSCDIVWFVTSTIKNQVIKVEANYECDMEEYINKAARDMKLEFSIDELGLRGLFSSPMRFD